MDTNRAKKALVTGNATSRRVAEHRSQHVRLDVSINPRIGLTLDDLASHFDTSRSVVVRSLLRFALTNRDWRQQGLLWRDE